MYGVCTCDNVSSFITDKDEPVKMDITMSICNIKEAELKEIIKHNECINVFEIFDLDQNSEDINTTTLGTICDCETDKCNSIYSGMFYCGVYLYIW